MTTAKDEEAKEVMLNFISELDDNFNFDEIDEKGL